MNVKGDFIRMRTKEQWGVSLSGKDNLFSKKQVIYPGELVGTKVITHLDTPVHHELGKLSQDLRKKWNHVQIIIYCIMSELLPKEKKGAVIWGK